MQEMTHNHTKALDRFYRNNRNSCTHCGHPFVDGETAHLGYQTDRSPAVLCDKCANLLNETVVRYYWKELPYVEPDPNSKLWRYMDISKFISILVSKSLYFAPAESFDDPFEGAKGTIVQKEKWDNFYLDFFRNAIKTAPGISKEACSPKNLEKDAHRLLQEIADAGLLDRKATCISCWHNNEYESEAMWKLYSKNVENAIAIETTVEKLNRALGEHSGVYIGKIQYIDFNKQFSKIGRDAFWYKRKSFEHEQEVRAITVNYERSSYGVSIPVDIDELIDNIYVSPYAPEWFTEVVHDIVAKYGLNKPVLYSSMRDHPFY